MANEYEYENLAAPTPYKESDGGEYDNTATTDDISEVDESKQNAISTDAIQPVVPTEGDLWVDVNVTPHILYIWRNDQWNKLTPTSATEVGAATEEFINSELAKKQDGIPTSNTPPNSPLTNTIWLDTSTTPNRLKRWDGSQWVMATPTNFSELGGQITASQIPTGGITAAKMNWSNHLIF